MTRRSGFGEGSLDNYRLGILMRCAGKKRVKCSETGGQIKGFS